MEAWYAHGAGKLVVAYTGGMPRIVDGGRRQRRLPTWRKPSRHDRAGRGSWHGGRGRCGALGAAPRLAVLAARGWGVALLGQHAIGHDLGGSGHETRSFRLSHSDADDVRLAVRALGLWNDLERRGGDAPASQRAATARLGHVPPMAAALRGRASATRLDHRDVSRLFPRCAPVGAPAIFQPAAR
jgi:hypothetical protein